MSNLHDLIEKCELSAAEVAAVTRNKFVIEAAGGNSIESLAGDALAEGDEPLSALVLSKMIDSGAIAGHEHGCGTLAKHDPHLASGLAKIDALIPKHNPLAPVDDVDFSC